LAVSGVRQDDSAGATPADIQRQETHREKTCSGDRRRCFLGSHLCERLLKQECEVLCVDNFFTGMRRNIEPLLGEPR